MSVREDCLRALHSKLLLVLAEGEREILRNAEEPMKIPSEGFVNLFDGESGEPESVTLSPVSYAYDHRALCVLIVKSRSQEERDKNMNAMLEKIGAALAVDKTLGGVCDYCEPMAPEVITQEEDGMLVKVVQLPIMVWFVTSNPLI